jgi:hypothetical protein
MHAVPTSTHWPVASHFWGWSRLHRVESGLQTPVQVPVLVLQTFGQTAPSACHPPVALHNCG